MSTRYAHTVTAACPSALRDDANQLAACLGGSMADLQTYGEPRYEREGVYYSVMSTAATDKLLQASQMPVQRPAFDSDNVIDLVAAQRALDAVLIVTEQTPAQPDKIVVYVDVPPQQAIEAMGLELRTEDE